MEGRMDGGRSKRTLAPKGIPMPSCPSFPHTCGPAQTRNFDKSHEPTSLGTNLLFLVVQQTAGILHTGLQWASHLTPATGSKALDGPMPHASGKDVCGGRRC